MRIIVLALAFIFLALPAHAMDCNQVRDVVKKLGKDKSEQLARLVGASQAQIEEGRLCFRKAK
jgi:hypothetical protein